MLRPSIPVLVILAVAISGCASNGYVRTSLEGQRGFQRTAHEVRVSDKRRGSSADVRTGLVKVQHLLAAGEFAQARREANQVLKKAPDSADAHTYLAVALEQGGDSKGAGKHYRRAAELVPTSGAALGNYGAWLCGQGHAAESLVWFDRAQKAPRAGNRSMLLTHAGVCASRSGQHERAEQDLRGAIALDPENALALGTLAKLAFRAGRALEARAFSERRLAAAPADPQALLLASQIEQKLGDRAAAARYVARLNAEFPDALEARSSTMGNGGRQ